MILDVDLCVSAMGPTTIAHSSLMVVGLISPSPVLTMLGYIEVLLILFALHSCHSPSLVEQ